MQRKPDTKKIKKKPLPKRAPAKPKVPPPPKAEKVKTSEKPKSKPSASKSVTIKRNNSSSKSSSNTDEDDDDNDDVASQKSSNSKCTKKRKHRTPESKTEFTELVVKKRMASLNATAMLAASYEVERHLDRCDSMYNSSSAESHSETPPSPKKIKDIKHEIIDEPKEVITKLTILILFI